MIIHLIVFDFRLLFTEMYKYNHSKTVSHNNVTLKSISVITEVPGGAKVMS